LCAVPGTPAGAPHRPHLPDDDVIYTVIRLLTLDIGGPLYHVAAPNGTLRLVHESQIAAAAD
jgi:hypothetical protein